MGFQTIYRLMQVKIIAECSKGHPAILATSLSYNLSFRSLFCLFLSGSFSQVLLYCISVNSLVKRCMGSLRVGLDTHLYPYTLMCVRLVKALARLCAQVTRSRPAFALYTNISGTGPYTYSTSVSSACERQIFWVCI